MKKIELLLPAGNIECLRAAVNNGADAVYLGLERFNARQSAGNFKNSELKSIVDFCHKKNVKVYVALNTIVKNSEIEDYLKLINVASQANADAIIIQDSCLIPTIKKNFPDISIHLSTQATITNASSVPNDVDRVVLARELKYEEIKQISNSFETEIFVHGALCVSYSGLCIFSSIIGGRSGNRGQCSQTCRRIYNNKHLLSTKDLCLINKLGELEEAGVKSFKIEGRMRSSLYVGTVARVYRKALDGENITEQDMKDLLLAFNREFTEGFAFTDEIIDAKKPMNRGLYLGFVRDGKVMIKEDLKPGDGISIWKKKYVIGQKIDFEAQKGDLIDAPNGSLKGDAIYKTSSVDLTVDLGEEIPITENTIDEKELIIPSFEEEENNNNPVLIGRAYNKSQALELGNAKADIVYYDILAPDFLEVKEQLKRSKLFAMTPKIVSDEDIESITKIVEEIKPDGVLIQNRGFISKLESIEGLEIHNDLGAFNDLDLDCLPGKSILSRELSYKEIKKLKHKNTIVQVHGELVVMILKQKLKAPELIDEEDRHFKVREMHGTHEILNYNQLGLFNKTLILFDRGIRNYYIDCKDAAKFIGIYRKILTSDFDDNKIRRGYTTGHFNKGIL